MLLVDSIELANSMNIRQLPRNIYGAVMSERDYLTKPIS
jgi:hypothetical protein